VTSLAGPFAGFALYGLVLAFIHLAPRSVLRSLPPLAATAIDDLEWVNLYWGMVNLIPVLPFDGGHVLEEALGPTRIRATAIISLAAGLATAAYFAATSNPWPA